MSGTEEDPLATTLRESGERYTIDRPQIELAVFDVRYSGQGEAPSLKEGFSIRDTLETTTNRSGWTVDSAQMHEFVLEVDAEGSRARETSAPGVRLTHPEDGVEIAIFAGMMTVQVQQYRRWSESLQPYVQAALHAVEAAFQPVSRSRIGLRYVNTLKDESAAPAAWGDRIVSSLSGFVAEGPFARYVVAAQNQIQLNFGEGMQASLRHGLLQLPHTGSGYLLDWDVYDVSSELFSAADVLSSAERLNREAATLFRSSLTIDFLDELGFKNIDNPPEGEDG